MRSAVQGALLFLVACGGSEPAPPPVRTPAPAPPVAAKKPRVSSRELAPELLRLDTGTDRGLLQRQQDVLAAVDRFVARVEDANEDPPADLRALRALQEEVIDISGHLAELESRVIRVGSLARELDLSERRLDADHAAAARSIARGLDPSWVDPERPARMERALAALASPKQGGAAALDRLRTDVHQLRVALLAALRGLGAVLEELRAASPPNDEELEPLLPPARQVLTGRDLAPELARIPAAVSTGHLRLRRALDAVSQASRAYGESDRPPAVADLDRALLDVLGAAQELGSELDRLGNLAVAFDGLDPALRAEGVPEALERLRAIEPAGWIAAERLSAFEAEVRDLERGARPRQELLRRADDLIELLRPFGSPLRRAAAELRPVWPALRGALPPGDRLQQELGD